MTPLEWNAALERNNHWKRLYPIVAKEVRKVLTDTQGKLSAIELVERLYPQFEARGENIKRRNRLFKALRAIANYAPQYGGCADCCTRSEKEQNVMGNLVKPWLWHASGNGSAPETKRVTSDLWKQLLDKLNELEGELPGEVVLLVDKIRPPVIPE